MRRLVERVSFWFFLVALFLGFRAGFILLGAVGIAVLAKLGYDFAVDVYSERATSVFAEQPSHQS